MLLLFLFTLILFHLSLDLEESLFSFPPWQSKLFLPLFKFFHLLGLCSPSSSSSVVWDRSPTMYLRLCWVCCSKNILLYHSLSLRSSCISSQLISLSFSFCPGSEILTGNVRVLFSSLGVCLGFAVGYMMLPLFAYFLRDWKSLLLALSLPGLLYIPLWWWVVVIARNMFMISLPYHPSIHPSIFCHLSGTSR